MKKESQKSLRERGGGLLIVTIGCPHCEKKIEDIDFILLTDNELFECPHCHKFFDPSEFEELRERVEFLLWCYETHDRIVEEKKMAKKAKKK